MKEWHFNEKVYRKWLAVWVGPYQEFVEGIKQYNYDDVDTLTRSNGYNVRLRFDNSDVQFTVIWLPKMSQATLVHELVHFTMDTFYNANIPISYQNEEAFAYYIEYLIREINRIYKRYPEGRTVAQAKK